VSRIYLHELAELGAPVPLEHARVFGGSDVEALGKAAAFLPALTSLDLGFTYDDPRTLATAVMQATLARRVATLAIELGDAAAWFAEAQRHAPRLAATTIVARAAGWTWTLSRDDRGALAALAGICRRDGDWRDPAVALVRALGARIATVTLRSTATLTGVRAGIAAIRRANPAPTYSFDLEKQ
jgi:hypothetical protein